jgi:hypothetical protein
MSRAPEAREHFVLDNHIIAMNVIGLQLLVSHALRLRQSFVRRLVLASTHGLLALA